jgi:Na+/melibiose symporter-like transporter
MAGILLQFAGISGAFALSMAVYAVSLALLLWLTTPQSPPTPASQSMLQSIRSSFGYIFKSRTLVGILLVTVIYNIFGFPATAMVPVIGRDYLHLAPSGVGVLASMEGVGITIGGLLIASLVSARAYRSVYALGLALCMAGWLIFATVDHAMIAALWLVAAGIGAAGFSSMQSSLLILNTTGQYRSRIFGVLSVCVGTAPIGFLQIGLLAEFIGAPTAVIVSSCAGVLALIVLRLYWPGMLAAQSAEVDAN